MYLHLCNDEKFIGGSYDTFERFYTSGNLFIINSLQGNLRFVKSSDRIVWRRLSQNKVKHEIYTLAREMGVKSVFVHYLDYDKARIALHLKKALGVEIYWIFYGSDLYTPLSEVGLYQLYDHDNKPVCALKNIVRQRLINTYRYLQSGWRKNQYLEKFAAEFDHFCFWNRGDFELLQKHFRVKADFREFCYVALSDNQHSKVPISEIDSSSMQSTDNEIKIVINHSGSLSGNHRTILDKLKALDASVREDSKEYISEIYLPLSYGNPVICGQIATYATTLFGDRAVNIMNFLPLESYYRSIGTATIAVYGHRRQEAAGNIFQMLANGVKVFLRNDSNLMQYFDNKGINVYSFEDELNSIEDLLPLSDEIKCQNRAKILELFSVEAVDNMVKKITLNR